MKSHETLIWGGLLRSGLGRCGCRVNILYGECNVRLRGRLECSIYANVKLS